MAEERKIVKRVKNAVLFSDDSIRLENVRCSYPHVAQPQESVNEETGVKSLSYSMQALMPKDTHRAAKDLCKEIIEKKLKEAKVKAIAADRKFIKDGDTMAKDETEGQWVVTSREAKRPMLRSNKKDPETGKAKKLTPEQAQEMIYGGCYVNVLIRPWWQNNKFGKRVNAGLVAVQFLKDGEAFGQGRIKEDDVDESFDGEDDEDGGFAGADDDDDL